MVKSVLDNVLEEIYLSESEKKALNKLASDFVKKMKSVGVKAVVGGSLAKGTLVKKEKQDVDIFIVFKDEKDLVKLDKLIKKAGYTFKVVHGSRDYYHIENELGVLEVIPVLKVKNPELAKNVTDVSLMHVDYIKKKIKENKNLVNEIILAKAFCQANEVYGAESYIEGFSGYSLEILVSYFGSFVKFLKGIQKKQIIDPVKYFKNSGEIFRELNASKLCSPVVLVDPTYKYRNVCAGLSQETFDKFLAASRDFLKKPSESFFVKKEFDIEEFKKIAKLKKAEFLELDLETNRQAGDIAGTKMKKFFNYVVKHLIRKQHIVLAKNFVYGGEQSSKGYIIVKENKEQLFLGPEKGMKEAIKLFKKVHKKTFYKKGKICAFEKNSLRDSLLETSSIGLEMGVSLAFR